MMKKDLKQSLRMGVFLFGLLSIMVGCGQPKDSDGANTPHPEEKVKVDFNLDIQALRSQVLEQHHSRVVKTEDLLRGSLIAKNQNTDQSETFSWVISLDDENWQATSLKTIVLDPAPYQFSLLLNEGNQQYAGTAIATIQDGTNDVSMTIRPIIGNTVTNVSVVSELASFKVQYSALALARFTTPKVGVSIDGAAEVIYTLNKESGLQTESQYINPDAGERTIKVNFYDGATLVGKSDPDQETQMITPGQSVSIDLLALQSETTFALTTEGTEGKFDFKIPAVVIDEAGGTENLSVKFSISGNKTALQENILTLGNISGDSYPATATLTNLYYDQVTLSLEFLDQQQNNEKFGYCTIEVTLSANQNSSNCAITLHRRTLIAGELLAAVGVQVIDESQNPIQGVPLKIGETLLGMTGSGTFGAPGYLKLFLKAGTHRIEAFKSGLYGFIDISADAAEIQNHEIILNSYTSCKAIKENHHNTDSGIYIIDPDGAAGENPPFEVYCDMETDGGGWTVIQRRQDGSVNFYIDWNSYKSGFGSLTGEHWLGNDKIHLITNTANTQLRIDMKWLSTATSLEEQKYAQFSSFSIADESDKYRLTVGGFSNHAGNPGDSLTHHSGAQFSTKDEDNDTTGEHCAATYLGAWWYRACHQSNLNAVYGNTSYGKGLTWLTWTGYYSSPFFIEMKIR